MVVFISICFHKRNEFKGFMFRIFFLCQLEKCNQSFDNGMCFCLLSLLFLSFSLHLLFRILRILEHSQITNEVTIGHAILSLPLAYLLTPLFWWEYGGNGGDILIKFFLRANKIWCSNAIILATIEWKGWMEYVIHMECFYLL